MSTTVDSAAETQEWPLGAPDLVAPSTPTKSHLHPRSGPHEHKIAAIVEGSRRAVGQQRPSQALPRADFRLQRETGMHTLAFEAAPGGSDTIQLTRDSARLLSETRSGTGRTIGGGVARTMEKEWPAAFGGGGTARTMNPKTYPGPLPDDRGSFDANFYNPPDPMAVPEPDTPKDLPHSMRALRTAVVEGSIDDMFELLGRGINLNGPLDADGKTALHYIAMRKGCGGCPDPKQKPPSTFEIAAAAEAVEEGATAEPESSPEPIGAACPECGCVMPKPETATQILLEHGASDRCATYESGWLPLHLACIKGHTETVRSLLQWDSTTAKAKDRMLRTAAHLQGSADGEILAMLRHVGADLYAQDERLRTPLHAAVFGGLKASVNFLSLDIASPQSRRSQRMGIVKPADPFGVVDEDGSAALHLAVSENHFMIVKFLVISDEKALDREDSRGRTPLELAEVALRGMPGSKILAYLRNAELERREEIDIDPDKYPLHSFALQGSLDELRATMGSRLQFLFGSRDEKGYTPLHYAAWAGHVKCVKWLQNRQGVETEDETDVYENAIEIAARNRHQPVVDFLQYGLEAEEEQELEEESDESEEEEIDPDLDYTNDDCTVKRENETQGQYLERLYTLHMLMLPPIENAADALKLVGGKVPDDPTVQQRLAAIQVRKRSIEEIALLQKSLDARLFDMQEKYKEVKRKERRVRLQVHEMLAAGVKGKKKTKTKTKGRL